MAQPDLLLGIDVGTTGCKALLVDPADGRVVAASTHEYPLHMPRPLWAEQDPADWWAAARQCIRDVIAKGDSRARIASIGVTGQMHGLVLLDAHGEVIRPAILWNDQRTAEECRTITETLGAARVLELTGNPVLTGFTAPKIAWVQRHEPDHYSRIAHILLPKDYVRFRLTGEYACDVADTSGTSLFDVRGRRWSDEMIEAAGVRRAWLPAVLECAEVSGRVTPDASAQTGLPAGIPVVAGAGDQAAGAIGSGIVRGGDVSVTLGTSGVVFAACEQYRVEPQGRLHAFCHAASATSWHLMGVMLSAGGSLRWYRDTLCDAERAQADASKRNAYDLMLEPAGKIPAGCEDLIFLPYLTGERTPHADPNARGVFFGLTLRHSKAHLTRAVLEGVAFGLRDSLELIRGLGVQPTEIRISGGGAASPLWRQILADVFNCRLVCPAVNEGAAYGAALLAGVGIGAFADASAAAKQCVRLGEATVPGASVSVYARSYQRFRSLYPALASHFEQPSLE